MRDWRYSVGKRGGSGHDKIDCGHIYLLDLFGSSHSLFTSLNLRRDICSTTLDEISLNNNGSQKKYEVWSSSTSTNNFSRNSMSCLEHQQVWAFLEPESPCFNVWQPYLDIKSCHFRYWQYSYPSKDTKSEIRTLLVLNQSHKKGGEKQPSTL